MLVVVAAVAYWYWSGPYQERVNPSYQQKLRKNSEAMSDCVARKHYAATRSATNPGNLEELCAQELNLYEADGQWHSYDEVREE